MAATRLVAPDTPTFVHHEQYMDWWRKIDEDAKLAVRIKCERDLGWFINNHGWLVAKPDTDMAEEALATATKVTGWKPTAGWQQFRLWPGQEYAISKIQMHWLTVVLKVRQFGATWMAAHRAMHSSVFFSDQHIALISLEKSDRAREFGERALSVWNHIPPDLHGVKALDNMWGTNLRGWENGSKLRILATTEFGSASFTLTGCAVDECCLIEESGRARLSELVGSGVIESLRLLEGWLMLISTGRTRAGYFYRLVRRLHYEKLEVSPPKQWDDFGFVFIPAREHPHWQIPGNYARQRLKNAEDPEWVREHPENVDEAFTANGLSCYNTVRVQETIDWIESGDATTRSGLPVVERRCDFHRPVKHGKRRHHPRFVEEGKTSLYVERVKGHRYIAFIDPSEGKTTGDYTGIVVADCTVGEVVAVHQEKISEEFEIAAVAMNIGRYYNWALLIPEINKLRGVLKEMQRCGYPFIYFATRPGTSPIDQSALTEYGWRTNPGEGSTSKTLMIAAGRTQILKPIEQRQLALYHVPLLNEMFTFIENTNPQTGKIKHRGAPQGGDAHDDMVDGWNACCYVYMEEPEHLTLLGDEPTVGEDEEDDNPYEGAVYVPSQNGKDAPGWGGGPKADPADEWHLFDEVLGNG